MTRSAAGTTHAAAAREAKYLVLCALRYTSRRCVKAATWRFKSLWAAQFADNKRRRFYKNLRKVWVHST